MRTALVLLASFALLACTSSRRRGVVPDGGGGVDTGFGSDADTDGSIPGTDGGGSVGSVERYVISDLELAAAPYGVNVDGLVSFESDAAGCFFEDHTSPFPDDEPGADNNLGPFLAAFGDSFDPDLTPSILSGDILLLLEVRSDGASRSVSFYRGTVLGGGVPSTSGGTLVPGQTFEVTESLGTFAGADEEGRTRVGPTNTRLTLLPGSDPVSLFDARMYGSVTPAGISDGVLGGALSFEDVAELVSELGAIDLTTALSILEAQSDIPSVAGGSCNRISAATTFSAVPAIFTP